ncbi:hypothetical protein FE661_05505 [Acidithiobacillus ferrooxidans]|uniref:Xylulose 5-phosphate/Fructose 6-phosphate phosphoketolase N-terminal domain-containing protein n=1 Tax=Acidithiobacillus ferrooxidans TaxID=920 RepID=A0A2W1K574_ACIFR|nr:hypothetical protein [Acidithiobacillus ferridurans]MBU2819618.1 hypothetical protein [Acidithiobacillus ferrooxidans]PZD82038.1 hypothetical protein DN052_03005 [Acidithiobacillus ferrooxidans]QLK43589.1 hypothetical protein FE661_05505 [Acidithiobacillus ferrooxidans]
MPRFLDNGGHPLWSLPLKQRRRAYEDENLSAYGPPRATIQGIPLAPDELRKTDAYWRASLYLCLGMLYLRSNPLLREPLRLEHIKPRLLGHWGVGRRNSIGHGRRHT